MPLYELRCCICYNEWEQYSSVDNRNSLVCPECQRATGDIQISLSNPYTIKSGFNKDIGVEVTGPKQYREFLKDNHMEEVYGRST